MCGIAGIISETPTDSSALERMLLSLSHRGPDDDGWLLGTLGEGFVRGRGPVPASPSTVALGHRRLSIIDLSVAGWQPFVSPDGRYALTYNGEIYNYVELREELRALGWAFQSECDTEVLLAGWAYWGKDILRRVTGMFAFCLVDFSSGKAYLARDHIGIKPLFVSLRGGQLLFASEPGALRTQRGADQRLDPAMTYAYLRYGRADHDERTLFDGITQLPPATVDEFDLTDLSQRRREQYWRLPAEAVDCSFAEAVAAVRAGFERSVRLHLRSDVPVGAALSGGIDSSAIVAMARKVAGPDLELHCFSYLADDPRVDESAWVAIAAEAAGAHVHPVVADSTSLRETLQDLIRSQGEPFGGTSIYAQRRVFEEARRAGVTVLLDGQGADELFGGYRAYLAARFAGQLRRGRLVSAARLAAGVLRLPDVTVTPATALRAISGAAPGRLRPWLVARSGAHPFPAWMNRAWFEACGIEGQQVEPHADLNEALSQAFLQTSLPSLLRYEDRNSMRFSLESRVPFLERDFVELVFRLPSDFILAPDGTSKWVFREAMRGIVPDAILNRRDKIGFTTPEDRWLRSESPWVLEVIAGLRTVPWCNFDALEKGAREYLSGRPMSDHVLWRWINLALWQEAVGIAA